MLKHIPPILGPDILHILQSMGHGDEIVIVDANYPGTSAGPTLARMDGHAAPDVLDAILTLMPLDDFVAEAAVMMEVAGDPARREPVMTEFIDIVGRHEATARVSAIERFAFYDRARAAYAIVQTGERRLYGNIILKKGIIRPDA